MSGERVEGEDRMSKFSWRAIGLMLFGERVGTAWEEGMTALSTAISSAHSPLYWWAEKGANEPLESPGEEG